MKSTATTAMETLIAVPPVQVSIKARAFATADRLTQNGLWTRGFTTGHGKIRGLIQDPILDMPRDRIKPEINFERQFDCVLTSRDAWLDSWPNSLPAEGKMGFSDGSKTSLGTGAGVFTLEPEGKEIIHLGKLASVFQAEAVAVRTCLLTMLPSESRNEKAFICTDSESVIKALMSPIVTSKLIKELKETLNQIGMRNQITLVWVPGHSGIEYSEIADGLAKRGSTSEIHGPEPFIPIPQSLCEEAIEKWKIAECENYWNRYEGGTHTKSFFQAPNRKWARELLDMDRSSIRRVVGAITGHCGLNKHLSKMRKLDNPNCACGVGEETGLHVICECSLYSSLRLSVLGSRVIEPSKVPIKGPVALDRFLMGTGRFERFK